MDEVVKIGTRTPWGKVCGVMYEGGERFYWIMRGDKTVAKLDAHSVETSIRSV